MSGLTRPRRAYPLVTGIPGGSRIFIAARLEYPGARYLLLTVPWAHERSTWLSTS